MIRATDLAEGSVDRVGDADGLVNARLEHALWFGGRETRAPVSDFALAGRCPVRYSSRRFPRNGNRREGTECASDRVNASGLL